MHGRASPVEHDGRTLFHGLPNPLKAGRYHSLVVAEAGLPNCLEVSARSPDGEIMAVRHREMPLEGVQFHPESILSDHGLQMMQNWLEMLR
jgi:anthranilate synthase/aminodeoxychorismate synthase-like glutamine amidotransferase